MKNRICKKPDGQVWLELAHAPVSGSQRRFLGTITGGVFEIERGQQHWHRKAGCWYVNYELLRNHEHFGFDLVFIVGTDGRGDRHAGWVSVAELIADPERVCYSHTGFEMQVALRPEMLNDLRAEAERVRNRLTAKAEQPEPQMALFAQS